MRKISVVLVPAVVTLVIYVLLQIVMQKILKLDLNTVPNPQSYIVCYYVLLTLFIMGALFTFISIVAYLKKRYKQLQEWKLKNGGNR